jgi:hypothetical protein
VAAVPSRPAAARLTRRALLLVTIAGLAGLAYLEERKETMPLTKFKPIAVHPSQVLDLQSWKINLPTGNQQVTQPQLASFHDAAFMAVTAVQFTAPCGGEPQPGSSYPRSELREMNPDGSLAAWSSTSGGHTLELTQRITHLPVVKPQLICAQIHSDTAYLIMIELDANSLYVRYRDSVAGYLDRHYQLGTFFDLRITAAGGSVDVFYNGVHKVRQAMAEGNCYFKAGCYVQSNTSTGDEPTAYGQVEISQLIVAHSQ